MAVNQRKDSKSVKVPAGFEAAVAATGFGRFNLLLLLICVPVAWTTQFEQTLASYIIPVAACDLELTPTQKSFLNTVSLMGMISSGFIWGVLLDLLGRKRIVLTGFLIQIFMVIGQSLSQNIYFLSVFKFCGGAVTGGLYVATNTYLMEFHSTEYRGKIQMVFGMTYCISNLVIPLICSAILPLKFTMQLYFMEFKAWNLLILVSSSTSIIAYTCFNFLPESPKFLMSMGDNEQALKIFRNVYRLNTGKTEETYPYEYLIEEVVNEKETPAGRISILKFFKIVWEQVKPLFGKQYRMTLLLVCVVQANFQMAINILRFYMPQVFQATHEYQVAHNGTSPDLCSVLDLLRVPKPADDEEFVCTVNLDNNFAVYFSSTITAIVALIFYIAIGIIINFVGRKHLMIVLGLAAGVCGCCMYVSTHPIITLALSSLYLAKAALCYDLFVTIVMVLFPTKMRAMSYSTCLSCGRLMTVIGNMVFVYIVEVGCALPFLSLGGIMFLGVTLSCLVPNTDKIEMK